jgi:hypothetical protein
MITVVEIVVGLLIYTAIAKWRKKQEEKQEDREYAAEVSRNWERHPGMYSHWPVSTPTGQERDKKTATGATTLE